MSRTRLQLGLASVALIAWCAFCLARHGHWGRRAGATAVPLKAAALHARQHAGLLTLSGSVSDDTTRRQITAQARDVFGTSQVLDQLQLDPSLNTPQWLARVPHLLSALRTRLPSGEWTLDGAGLRVRGAVSNEAARAEVLQAFVSAAGPSVAVKEEFGIAPSTPFASPKVEEAAPVALQRRLDDFFATHSIEFETSSAELSARGLSVLEALAPLLRASPGVRVEIGGHTDSRGAAESNRRLSNQRAEAVRARLLHLGVAPEQLTAVGYGDTRPVADNATPAGQQRNRRIEFRVKP